MATPPRGEEYTSILPPSADPYVQLDLFDNNHLYQHFDDHYGLQPRQWTSQETGTPVYGKYAQDGFWDDESDTTTLRQRASTSTAHTVMPPKSPASVSVPRPPSSKADHSTFSSPSTATASPRPDQRGEARPETRFEDRENQRSLFGWAKRPSMANLQAPALQSHASEDEACQIKEPAIHKKKSFGLFKGMTKRSEPVVDAADESFEAGPPPSTPSTCRSMRSDPRHSPTNRSRTPSGLGQHSATQASEIHLETETKTKQSGWKRGMNKLFKAKSFNTLRTAEPSSSAKSPSVRPKAPGVENDVPPVPTLPLNIKKRNVSAQTTYGASGPTPPPSSTRSEFPSSSRTRRPSGVKRENGSHQNKTNHETRQPNSNSVYSILMSPSPSALSASFPLDSHPSLPLDPFASSLNASANNLPVSPSLSDFHPSSSYQQQSPKHDTLPARSKVPRHSPSLRDFKSFLPGGNKQKLAKTKSLANLSGRYKENDATVEEVPSKETEADQSLDSIHSELEGPPSIHRQSNSAPIESPPLVPPKPPYFPTISHSGRLDSSLPGSQSASTPSSPLTPPPTSPLPPLPHSTSPSVTSPVVGPSHTVPLAPAGEASSTPPTRSGSGAVLLPRSRSTSMSLKAPPTSSSFFDLYEQLGIWPTPEKKEAEEEAKKGEKEEPRSPLDTKTTLTTSISDLASKLEPAAQLSSVPNSGQVSASPSATFSSASWQAKLDAFPLVDGGSSVEAVADISMDFALPYVDGSAQLTDSPPQLPLEVEVDSLTPEDAVEGQRERAKASTTSQGGSYTHQSTYRHTQGTGLGFSETRASARRMSRDGSSSRGSSRSSRSRRNTRDTHCDSASSQEDDSEDDVPLSQLHPEAQAKREANEKRRAARRAEKAARAARRAVRSSKPVLDARNPGGSSKWNGEGGVPADLLAYKLSALQVRSEPLSQHPVVPPAGFVPHASWSRPRAARPEPLDTRAIRPQRSYTGPIVDQHAVSSALHRSSTTRAPATDEQYPRSPVHQVPPVLASKYSRSSSGQHGSLQPSPMINHSPALPSPTATHHSHSSSSRTSTRISHSPQVPPPSRTTMRESRDISRHNTTASSRSHHSTDDRHRLCSANDTNSRVPPPRSPVSLSRKPSERQSRGRARMVSVLVEGSSRRIDMAVYTDTNVSELLAKAGEELGPPSQKHSWVLCEAFGELGCERRLREYEEVAPVLNGWDPLATTNALVLRTSNNTVQVTARGIPNNPPMLGSWIQYETKKGKWSKRWLETRGGQVFMSKNEKYKDEHQINTLFHDVYLMAKDCKAPFPYVLVIKRNEPAKTFENPDEYMHVFSSDEGTLHRLANAIYDSKSFNLANTYPRLLVHPDERRRVAGRLVRSSAPAPARHPEGTENKPLIDYVPSQAKEKGFTGKGLLAGRSRTVI